MNARLNELLKQTSRSFYLTLRVLPAAVRSQIGLAYLLARTTDTIADTEIMPQQQRLEALRQFRERILGVRSAPLNFGELARNQSLPAERALLENCEMAVAALDELSRTDLQLTRTVLETITGGQELDLQRFDGASAKRIVALRNDEELEDYTYRVAGCVGEFWTRMCRAHLFPEARLDDAQLLADGIQFGNGLQLVNILRDLPEDLQKGRCYLPRTGLAELDLAPLHLLQPENEPKLRPLYNRWLARAESHLAAGWAYTNSLPFAQVRVRLACAWPILIGMRTIERLSTANVLDAGQRVKVPRGGFRGVMVRSVLCYPSPPLWRRQFPAPSPV